MSFNGTLCLPPGLKPAVFIWHLLTRLKSCPFKAGLIQIFPWSWWSCPRTCRPSWRLSLHGANRGPLSASTRKKHSPECKIFVILKNSAQSQTRPGLHELGPSEGWGDFLRMESRAIVSFKTDQDRFCISHGNFSSGRLPCTLRIVVSAHPSPRGFMTRAMSTMPAA